MLCRSKVQHIGSCDELYYATEGGQKAVCADRSVLFLVSASPEILKASRFVSPRVSCRSFGSRYILGKITAS